MQRKWGTYIHPNGLSAPRQIRRSAMAASVQDHTCHWGKLIESAQKEWKGKRKEGKITHRFSAEVESWITKACSWKLQFSSEVPFCHQSRTWVLQTCPYKFGEKFLQLSTLHLTPDNGFFRSPFPRLSTVPLKLVASPRGQSAFQRMLREGFVF